MVQTVVAYDSETVLIKPPDEIPPRLVCGSFAEVEPAPEGFLLERHATLNLLRDCLKEKSISIVGANLAFDIHVSIRAAPDLLPLWVSAAEEGRLHDVLLRQQLIDLSRGKYEHKYSLGLLSERYLKISLDKGDDSWRLRYEELLDVPIDQYPEAAARYAILDVEATALLYLRQERENYSNHFPGMRPLDDEANQVMASIWLRATSDAGIPVDAAKTEELAVYYEKRAEELRKILVECGLVRPPQVSRVMTVVNAIPSDSPLRSLLPRWKEAPKELLEIGAVQIKHTRDTKAIAKAIAEEFRARGKEPRRTDSYDPAKHGPYDCISTDAEACSQCDSPAIKAYADYSSVAKSLSNDIPMLRQAAKQGDRIHTHFTVLRESGRTSSSAPNVQNWGRKGDTRGCVVASPGYVLIETDKAALELRTFAQICLWLGIESRLAEALNGEDENGKPWDIHSLSTESSFGIPYAECLRLKKAGDKLFDDKRTAMKGAIFGKLGGLGAETFVIYAKTNYGLTITEGESADYLQKIQNAWPEIRTYLRWVNTLESRDGEFNVVQFATGRLRAGCTYCSAANSPFQGLGADVAKRAGWHIWKAIQDPSDPLHGSRLINFVHDSFILETPQGREQAAKNRQEELMMLAFSELLPDIKGGVESKIMDFWRK